METLLGIKGPDFAMLAADSSHLRGIFVLEDEATKIFPIGGNLMISAVGTTADASEFIEFLNRNFAFYRIRNGYELNPRAAAHFARKTLADFQRNFNNYKVNLLLAGYDEIDGPDLFYMDNMANAVSTNYGGLGYGSAFCGSIFDRYWHKNISQEEAYEVFVQLICELKKRFSINYKKFNVRVIDKDGIHSLEPILTDN